MVKCQVCGYKTISAYGSFEVCEVCFWEDDGLYDDPDEVRGGPNSGLSLTQARKNYREFGVVEKRFINNERQPTSNLSDYFSKKEFSLRHTVDHDINELVEIINDAYSYQDKAKGEPRTNPDHLRKRINETNFYTVLHDRNIIGCVYLEPKGPALHFGLLTLVPNFRGKGIANTIINAIEAYAEDNKFEAIDLDYMSLAPWLKKYYEKYGFAETGEVITWGSINLIKMQKRLCSE